jgi:thymidylate kinase
MKRGKLIVILGPVGVGKSTVGRYLTSILRRRGYLTYYIFIKAAHGLSFFVYYIIALLIFDRRLHNYTRKRIAPWYVVSKYNKILAEEITAITAVIDIFISLPFQLFRISLMRFFNNFIFCEEYLLGSINDYLYGLLKAASTGTKHCLRTIVKTLMVTTMKYKPYIIIILDANYQELLRRWRKRGYGELQWEYILFQKIFLKLLREGMFINEVPIYYIDSNKDIAIVLQKVLSVLLSIKR